MKLGPTILRETAGGPSFRRLGLNAASLAGCAFIAVLAIVVGSTTGTATDLTVPADSPIFDAHREAAVQVFPDAPLPRPQWWTDLGSTEERPDPYRTEIAAVARSPSVVLVCGLLTPLVSLSYSPMPARSCYGNGDSDPSGCSASNSNQGTCSTDGFPGTPACSASDGGIDGIKDSGQDTCSTGPGSGGGSGTTTCSTQIDSATKGGGCSAGLQKKDQKTDRSCSVEDNSPTGATCSVTGEVGTDGATEVDCSAGQSIEGKTSKCSVSATQRNHDTVCSATPGNTTDKNKAACSAWDMENMNDVGKPSGPVRCSVLPPDGGDTGKEVKCSVFGSQGGHEDTGGSEDGFCTVSTGGFPKGSGDAQCSVLVNPPRTHKCSSFVGNQHNPPNAKNKCHLPK
ncbi:MAG: hypothetical protein AB1486_05065 [Planctomycetota bacterium]